MTSHNTTWDVNFVWILPKAQAQVRLEASRLAVAYTIEPQLDTLTNLAGVRRRFVVDLQRIPGWTRQAAHICDLGAGESVCLTTSIRFKPYRS